MEAGTWTQTIAIVGAFAAFVIVQWAVVKVKSSVHDFEIKSLKENIDRVEKRALTQMDDINKKLDEIRSQIKNTKCPYSHDGEK
ncbi:MAG: hypothetical protein PHW53_04655 [Patescibacteria group bacterium]|nr:hypothetical protein [Patescibacteria group bacterium]